MERTKTISRNYQISQRDNLEIPGRVIASKKVRRNKKVKIKNLIPQVKNMEVKKNARVLRRMVLDQKLSSYH